MCRIYGCYLPEILTYPEDLAKDMIDNMLKTDYTMGIFWYLQNSVDFSRINVNLLRYFVTNICKRGWCPELNFLHSIPS
jgi:hypothetical protein